MNPYITRFDKATAPKSHNGTILAGRVLPDDLKAPFGDAWGYLEGASVMEPHSHPTDEVYIITDGTGYCQIDDDKFAIRLGDVIRIPTNAVHTMICEEGQTLLWAAFWWEHID